jgi:hypothetical protein
LTAWRRLGCPAHHVAQLRQARYYRAALHISPVNGDQVREADVRF